MKEFELADKFIEYFNDGYEVYKEVPAMGIIDIVAKSGPIIIAVEVKMNMNLAVIEQAWNNRIYANYSYVAIPQPQKRNFGYDVCNWHGIGVLEWSNVGGVVQSARATFNRKIYPPKLADYMKLSVAGSKNDRVTAFKNTINNIVSYLERHNGAKLGDTLKIIEHHWGSFNGAKSCVYHWVKTGVIKEFSIKKGCLYLNNKEI